MCVVVVYYVRPYLYIWGSHSLIFTTHYYMAKPKGFTLNVVFNLENNSSLQFYASFNVDAIAPLNEIERKFTFSDFTLICLLF